MTAFCQRCGEFFSPGVPGQPCPLCDEPLIRRPIVVAPEHFIVNDSFRRLHFNQDMVPIMAVYRKFEEVSDNGKWIRTKDSYNIGTHEAVEAWCNRQWEQKDQDENEIVEFIEPVDATHRNVVRYTWNPDSIHLLNRKKCGGGRCR